MPGDDVDREITLIYVRDDDTLRREFAHLLALFLNRPSPYRFDITPLVEALDQLGQQIPRLLVRLRRSATGQHLCVTLNFELPPAAAEQ